VGAWRVRARCNVALERTLATPAPRERVQFILGRCGIYQDASCGILRAMGFAAWPPYGISLAGTENDAQKQKSTRFFVCLFVLSSVF
jgi:hypothetical protein